jgi:acetate---CoA ligase (ADP-forming)
MNRAISCLMVPKSIAVIGASTDAQKTAGKPIYYLQKNNYQGKIFPVNPKVEQIAGLQCFPNIAALPETPDVAIILVGTDAAIQVVAELAKINTPVAIVLTSGFAETGPEGVHKQNELMRVAGKMRILGPNTMGMVNLTDQITLSPSGALAVDNLMKGSVSLVSQSGGVLGALLSRASARGIGLSKLISTSNEVDLGLADFIDYFVDDPATQIILLYIESIRQPQKFMDAAKRARNVGKPIVVFKVGKSEAGMQAAISHTGAIAGSDRLYDALFEQAGIIRARTFADFLDIPIILSTRKPLLGKRVAVLTSTGGAGTLIADSLGEHGFLLPAPDIDTANKLTQLDLGDQAILNRNPFDLTLAGLKPEILKGAIKALIESSSYDALILILGSSSVSRPDLMTEAVREFIPSSSKLIIAYLSPHAPRAFEMMTQLGIPTFTQPESCAVALSSVYEASIFKREQDTTETILPKVDISSHDQTHGNLDEYQAKKLFQQFGIPVVQELITTASAIQDQEFTALGSEVVVKILSKEILHKSDVGGVALGVPTVNVAQHVKEMQVTVFQRTGTLVEQFSIQEHLKGGFEMMLGMRKDPLGIAILVGMGGVTAELMQDFSLRLLGLSPLSETEAQEMLKELKVWPILQGYRGKPPCDVSSLVNSIVAFSAMVLSFKGRLLECEINPVLVFEEGLGCRAVDGILVFD